jgi:SET domain-containing protein
LATGPTSCDPNCITQIIPSDGRRKIVLYARRDVAVDEELTYDYKFDPEPMESKVGVWVRPQPGVGPL